jgi:hypothetical protein
MSNNPYVSPQTQAASNVRSDVPLMTWGKGIVIVVGTTVVGAAVGSAIGFALGRFVPDYYRSVFESGTRPEFDPVAVGIGQGLTQGTALGVVVGLVLVAAIARFKSGRLARTSASKD